MTKASDVTSGISDAYRRLTGVSPRPEALQLLESLYKKTLERFKSNPEKAKGWLKAGRAHLDPSLDPMRISANAVVASTIMNSDAAITKR